jgi:hypothetical protein
MEQAPMQISIVARFGRGNTASIVAHDEPELAGRVLYLGFDMASTRMAECVAERFSRDQVDAFLNRPRKFPAVANRAHFTAHSGGREILNKAGKLVLNRSRMEPLDRGTF